MVPRFVPEISSLDAFCDGAGAGAAGIGDSRSWIVPDGEDKNNVTYIGSSKMSICGQRQPASKTKFQINEVMLSKILGSNFKNKTLQSAKKRFHLQNCLYPVFSS